MAKKPSPLQNRLARHQARSAGVIAAVLQPADASRSLFEVAWDLLNRLCPLEVADAAELAECFAQHPAFSSADASGWVVGVLGASLAYPSTADPLADPRLIALETGVVAALGPDAAWAANGDHPLEQFRDGRRERGWSPVIQATFDRVVVARGNGLDLVLARADED
jgi:hypothetical protein